MSVQTYRALISLYTEFCLLSSEIHFSLILTKLQAFAAFVFGNQADFFSFLPNGSSTSFQNSEKI